MQESVYCEFFKLLFLASIHSITIQKKSEFSLIYYVILVLLFKISLAYFQNCTISSYDNFYLQINFLSLHQSILIAHGEGHSRQKKIFTSIHKFF